MIVATYVPVKFVFTFGRFQRVSLGICKRAHVHVCAQGCMCVYVCLCFEDRTCPDEGQLLRAVQLTWQMTIKIFLDVVFRHIAESFSVCVCQLSKAVI